MTEVITPSPESTQDKVITRLREILADYYQSPKENQELHERIDEVIDVLLNQEHTAALPDEDPATASVLLPPDYPLRTKILELFTQLELSQVSELITILSESPLALHYLQLLALQQFFYDAWRNELTSVRISDHDHSSTINYDVSLAMTNEYLRSQNGQVLLSLARSQRHRPLSVVQLARASFAQQVDMFENLYRYLKRGDVHDAINTIKETQRVARARKFLKEDQQQQALPEMLLQLTAAGLLAAPNDDSQPE